MSFSMLQERMRIGEYIREIKPELKAGDKFYYNKKWYEVKEGFTIDYENGGIKYETVYTYKDYRKDIIEKSKWFNVKVIDTDIRNGKIKVKKVEG